MSSFSEMNSNLAYTSYPDYHVKKDKKLKINLKKSTNSFKNLSDKNNKSKEAARSRRNRENDEFKYLASLLPLQNEITKQLDKASIIRLTISFLKLKQFYQECNLVNSILINSIKEKFEINSFIPSCLDGFMFLLGEDGKFLYITESISSVLGLSQVVVIGTHIFEYIHPEDREEFSKMLGLARLEESSKKTNILDLSMSDLSNESIEERMYGKCNGNSGKKVTFTIRFKSSLMKKANLIKSSGWRLIQIIGRLNSSKIDSNLSSGFFGIGLSVETQALCEISLSNSSFVIKLNNHLVVESIENFPTNFELDYTQLIGFSIFHLIHPEDLDFFLEKLIELKKKEHAFFSYRLAQSNVSNLLVNCSAVLIPKSNYSCVNSFEFSLIESFHILLINDLIEKEFKTSSSIDESVFNLFENPNESNRYHQIPDKNLPIKKNKSKMNTNFTKKIKTNDNDLLKKKAKKYFKIDSPKKIDEINELSSRNETFFETNFPLREDIHVYDTIKAYPLAYNSMEYNFQNLENFENSKNFEYYENDYSSRNHGSINNYNSSQALWDFTKQDDYGLFSNGFTNCQNYSSQNHQ